MKNDINELLKEMKPLLTEEDIQIALQTLEKVKVGAFKKECDKKVKEINDRNNNVEIPFKVYRPTIDEILDGLPLSFEEGTLKMSQAGIIGSDQLKYLDNPIYPLMEGTRVHLSKEKYESSYWWFEEVNIYVRFIIENKSNIELEEYERIYIDNDEFIVVDNQMIIKTTPICKANYIGDDRIKASIMKYINTLQSKYLKGGKANGK